jgi:hypothetical protein
VLGGYSRDLSQPGQIMASFFIVSLRLFGCSLFICFSLTRRKKGSHHSPQHTTFYYLLLPPVAVASGSVSKECEPESLVQGGWTVPLCWWRPAVEVMQYPKKVTDQDDRRYL